MRTYNLNIPEQYWKPLARATAHGYAGLFGISIGKKEFCDLDIMKEYMQFMDQTFRFSTILIADIPKRHTIMALEGIQEPVALRRALTAGNDIEHALERISRPFPHVKVARWSVFSQYLSYSDNLKIIQRSYVADTSFRKGVDSMVKAFLNIPNNKKKWQEISDDPPVALAKEYVLEELAMLTSFSASHNPVCEIYPGLNGLQELLHAGQYSFSYLLNMGKDRISAEVYPLGPQ
ncbi:MAG: tRNA-dependent cyclodipeptide synthase [Candidatus Woesearchaeota archaeon]|nr:tRNA-dependent cyclodipeptide synthase [Candidatus Woesearchaeota archaeon]